MSSGRLVSLNAAGLGHGRGGITDPVPNLTREVGPGTGHDHDDGPATL